MSFENQTCLSFSSTEFKIIAAVKASVGLTTILLGTITVIINVASSKYLFPFHRKALYVGVATVIEGISSVFNRVDYFFENEATRTFCVFAGLLNRYSNCALAAASFSIACSLFLDGLYADRAGSYQGAGRRPNYCRLSDWLWPSIIFVGPVLFVWVPFVHSAYGQSPGWPWCTVRTLNDDCSVFAFGSAINLVVFAIILLFLVTVVSFYIIAVVIIVKRRKGRREINYDHVIVARKQLLDRELRVLALPVLYIAVKFLVILTNLIVNRSGQFVFAMWFIYAVITSASGTVILAFTLYGNTCDRRSCRSLLLCAKSADYISAESYHPTLVEDDEHETVIVYNAI